MQKIRALIEQARQEELQNSYLHRILATRTSQVARIVDLPKDNAVEKLYEFVVRYIEDVPKMLGELRSVALEEGLIRYVQPVVNVACEFFLSPPGALLNKAGLAAVMAEAYLAHRLLEEVNAAYVFRVGQPLVPVEMTLANVIVHTLIGEPFANDLDALVEETAAHLFAPARVQSENTSETTFMSRRDINNLVFIGQHWSCMSAEMGLKASWFDNHNLASSNSSA